MIFNNKIVIKSISAKIVLFCYCQVTMNQIQEMLKLQQSLNDATNGKGWINGQTKEGRAINWNRCIYMEAVEALDSFNWKHWKDINAQDDEDNLLVELVDIWHFLMSEMIRLDYKKTPKLSAINKDKTQLIISIEKVAQVALSASLFASLESTSLEANKKTNIYLKQMLNDFFDCLVFSGMDIADLYRRYVVKNQLNTFRQNHGYKEGSYQKIWQTQQGAQEDNVVAFKLMADNNFSPDELYQALGQKYSG